MMQTFWMVFVQGAESPKFKHLRLDTAEAEANRLAYVTGKPVYILQAIKRGTLTGVTWELLTPAEEVP